MAIIGYSGFTKMYKTDLNVLKMVKIRDNWNCGKCRKKINKGSYAWGRDYQKFCLDCGFLVLNNFCLELKAVLKLLRLREKDYKEKLQEYKENNMVENL